MSIRYPNTTPWIPLSLTAKVKEMAIGYEPAARIENGKVVLRGMFKAEAQITLNETFATLPEGLRPTKVVKVVVGIVGAANVIRVVTIAENGTMQLNETLLLAGYSFAIDNISFSIT